MLVRRETAADIAAIRNVHAAAFAPRASQAPQVPRASQAPAGEVPAEAGLVEALRDSAAWLPALSLVVAGRDGRIAGHVVCSRAHIGSVPALGLGPLGVRPEVQRSGIGTALMHAVLGAADALDEPIVVLLGHRGYYPRFGFRPAEEYGITPPVAGWASHFQARPLAAYRPSIRGAFAYAQPFNEL